MRYWLINKKEVKEEVIKEVTANV